MTHITSRQLNIVSQITTAHSGASVMDWRPLTDPLMNCKKVNCVSNHSQKEGNLEFKQMNHKSQDGTCTGLNETVDLSSVHLKFLFLLFFSFSACLMSYEPYLLVTMFQMKC